MGYSTGYVELPTNDYTALMDAAGNGHKAVVGLLLEAKADVNAANGGTAARPS